MTEQIKCPDCGALLTCPDKCYPKLHVCKPKKQMTVTRRKFMETMIGGFVGAINIPPTFCKEKTKQGKKIEKNDEDVRYYKGGVIDSHSHQIDVSECIMPRSRVIRASDIATNTITQNVTNTITQNQRDALVQLRNPFCYSTGLGKTGFIENARLRIQNRKEAY